MGAIAAFGIILGLVQVLGDAGFSRSLVTYVSESIGGKRNPVSILRRVFFIGLCLALVWSSAVVFGGGLIMEALDVSLPPALTVVLALDSFLSCMTVYGEAALQGFNDFKSLTIARIFRIVIRPVSGVILLLLGLGLTGVVVGWALGDGLYLLQSLFMTLKGLAPYSDFPSAIVSTRQLFRFSLPLLASDLVGYLAHWFDQILLLIIMPIEQLAIYNVAVSIFNYAVQFPEALSTALLPYFSNLRGTGMMSMLVEQSWYAARYSSLIFTPIFLGLGSLSYPVITLIAGSSYSLGATPLALFCLFFAVTASSPGFSRILYVLKDTKAAAFVEASSAFVGISMAAVLGSVWGMVGVAVARGFAELAAYLQQYSKLRRHVSIRLELSTLAAILVSGLAMGLVVYVLQALVFLPHLMPLYVLGGSVTYALMLRTQRLVTQHDLDLLRDFTGQRIPRVVDFAEKLLLPRSSRAT